MTTPTTARATLRDEVHDHVGRRAAALVSGYLRDDRTAVATLARLRRSAGAGSPTALDADLWDALASMPERLLGGGDDPSPAERAVATALVLLAVHQQSRSDTPMHVADHRSSLGRAVARLAHATGSPGVERRFRALTRAGDLQQAVPHLRGLVTLLRAERVPLDYGRLAADLHQLQHPTGMQAVRVRWVRDYHRPTEPAPDLSPTPTSPTTGDPA